MANGLYDSGKPQRIIVEQELHHHHHSEVQVSRPHCSGAPGWTCDDIMQEFGEVCDRCPRRGKSAQRRATITPEFQVVKEPKRLK